MKLATINLTMGSAVSTHSQRVLMIRSFQTVSSDLEQKVDGLGAPELAGINKNLIIKYSK